MKNNCRSRIRRQNSLRGNVRSLKIKKSKHSTKYYLTIESTSFVSIVLDLRYDKAMIHCPQPCSTMDISLGYPILSTNQVPKEASMKLYFKSMVTVRKSVLTYNFTSMLAEIGGHIGLLLGFSLLDLTRIIDHFLIFSNCKCCHKEH